MVTATELVRRAALNVGAWAWTVGWPTIAAAQEAAEPIPHDWSHERRRLLIVLIGISILLGLFLWAVNWGARYTRRMIGGRPKPSRLGPDNWAARRFLKVARYRRQDSSRTDDHSSG